MQHPWQDSRAVVKGAHAWLAWLPRFLLAILNVTYDHRSAIDTICIHIVLYAACTFYPSRVLLGIFLHSYMRCRQSCWAFSVDAQHCKERVRNSMTQMLGKQAFAAGLLRVLTSNAPAGLRVAED